MTEFFSREAESTVLSSMLCKEDVFNYCCEVLLPSDFNFIENKLIFSELISFYKEDQTASLEKLVISLKSKGQLQEVGGIAGLTSITSTYGPVFDVDDIEFYVKTIKNNAVLRSIEVFNTSLAQKLAHTGHSEAEEVVEFCQSESDKLCSNNFGSIDLCLTKTINSVEENILNDYKEFITQGTRPSRMGLSTGYKSLDSLLSGLQNSHLVVLGARTGIGKTAFALNLLLNCCLQGKAALIFSLEMKAEEIVQRLISNLSGIGSSDIAECNLNEEKIQRIREATDKLRGMNIYCDEDAGVKINEIVSRAKRCKNKYKIDLIIIDYLQLIKGSKQTEIRHLEIADYTRSLKILAKELDVPVIILAQLARRIEDRIGHKIYLSDMRESGSIEQDSDSVIAISRRDMYDKGDRPGRAQVSVLKNRHGPTGEFELMFDGELGRFQEIPIQ